MTWPFADLRPMGYGVILADPPWHFELRSAAGEAKSAQAQYACMSLPEIKALPVASLAGKDCLLGLWATAPMLPEAINVMQAWGFRYVSALAWAKTTRHGRVAFGTGYWLRSAAEFLLLGTLGAPSPGSRRERNLIQAPRREHSRKPDAVYDLMERLAPTALCCELFARQQISRPWWHHWGNQVGAFAPSDAA